MEASTLIPVAEAAQMVGKSRMALMKAIAKGKLSASRDVHGRWQVDPAELTRVYKVVSVANGNHPQNQADGSGNVSAVLQARIEAMEGRIAEQAATIADLRTERDDWKKQAQQVALIAAPPKPRGLWHRLLGTGV